MNITRSSRVWLRVKRRGISTTREIADEMRIPHAQCAYVMLALYRNGCLARTDTQPYFYSTPGNVQVPGGLRLEELTGATA